MARAFNGSTDLVSITGVDLGTTHSIVFKLNYKDTADGVVIGGDDNGSGRIDYAPYISGSSAGDGIYYRASIVSVNGPISVVHGGLTSGTLYTIGISRSGTSVEFYKNGSKIGATQTLNANNKLVIKAFGNTLTGGVPATVELSEVAFYSVSLSSADQMSIHLSSPRSLAMTSCVGYWPLLGVSSPEPELRTGNSGTLTGTSAAAHPRIIYPHRRWNLGLAAAAGGFNAAWAQGANQVIGAGVY